MFLYCKLQYLISLIFSIFTPYQTHSACYIFFKQCGLKYSFIQTPFICYTVCSYLKAGSIALNLLILNQKVSHTVT